MDDWLKDHAINGVFDQIVSLQKDPAFTDPDFNLTPDQVRMRDRVVAILGAVRRLVELTPSMFVSMQGINSMQGVLQSIYQQLHSFAATGDVGNLVNAHTQVEQSLMPSLWVFALAPANAKAKALDGVVDGVRDAAETAISGVLGSRDRLSNQLGELTKRAAEQDRRVSELADTIDTQRREALAISSEVRGEYAKTEQDLRKQFEARMEEWVNSFKSAHTDVNAQTAVFLEQLRQHEADARKIVQVVGNIGVTGNYQKIANTEQDRADTWRLITVLFFGAGVAVALASIGIHLFMHWNEADTADSFWTFAMRFVTAVAIALPAFYTARESARHRTNADRARQKELELASIGPFIEKLPDASQVAIREKLTERYFGNGVEPHEIKPPVEPAEVAKVMQAVTEMVGKLKGG